MSALAPWREIQEACAKGAIQRIGAVVRLHAILDLGAKKLEGAMFENGDLNVAGFLAKCHGSSPADRVRLNLDFAPIR